MPKMTRSIEEVDAVRGKILDCAFDILGKHGYESLSMSKVGHKMKMTAANLYNYYSNKDELLIAIHKKAYGLLYGKMKKAVAAAATPAEKSKNMIYAFVDFATNNIHIYDVMFNRPIKQYSDYIGTPQEKISYEEYHSSLRVLRLTVDVIGEYRNSKKGLAAVDPRHLAIQCTSSLHGIISLHNSGVLKQIVKDPELALQSVIDRTISMILE